jgi:hypothetical protein
VFAAVTNLPSSSPPSPFARHCHPNCCVRSTAHHSTRMNTTCPSPWTS